MKARDGRCEGRKPFGMLPGESETLRIMRDMRANSTYADIATSLNNSGIPARSGGIWHTSTVAKILAR